MKPILSPKELAEAIGVSESSLKRWVDQGHIPAARTAGGHRRIHISDAVRFIRQTGTHVVRPDVLGLPDVGTIQADLTRGESPDDLLYEYLRLGDAARARGLIISLYLSGQPVAAIGDGPIRSAMHRLGELWQHDPAGIFIEHRATEICMEALRQLRLTLPEVRQGPTAVGGAPSDDPYALPSLLVALTLAAEGYQAVNLGPLTPLDAIETAAAALDARLVWLSATYLPQPNELRQGIMDLARRLSASGRVLAVGGQGVPALDLPRDGPYFVVRTLSELRTLAISPSAVHADANSQRAVDR